MSFPLTLASIVFVLMFILRMPIAIGMISCGSVYLVAKGMDLSIVTNMIMNTYFTNYVIIAVPLFIFTANIMNSGKVTNMIYGFTNAICGRMRGALGQVNILGSLIFAGMTGSAIADAAGLGKIEIESMRDAGYDDEFSCAITAASATVGPIFPPSIPLVIYAMLSGTSVGALFLGGMIPAILLTIFLMVYVAFIAKKRNYPRGEKLAKNVIISITLKAFPALLTPIILLVGIYTGIMTPTEAGAIAGLYALLISIFAYKAMGFNDFKNLLFNTISDIGTTSIIIGAASVISYIVAREQVAVNLATLIMSFCHSKYTFLLLVNISILILGMFIDTSIIQLVFVPILLPMAQAFGIDMVHFGLVVTFNMMVGLSTPPFGMLLFITSGISGTSLKGIMREVTWPIVVMLVCLIIITYLPEVVLFLPKMTGMI
jgi:tripartite ATP-independent transporter DctM subunit